MDEELRQALKNIYKKSLVELTDHDKAFLRARQSYVGKVEQEKYAPVFKGQLNVPVEPEKEQTDPAVSNPFPVTEEQTESVTEGAVDEDEQDQVLTIEDSEDDEAEG